MAKQFLVNIDLVKNQILNPLFQILASDPSTPEEGQFWYNSTEERFRYRGDGVTYTPLVNLDDIPNGSIDIDKLTVDPLDRANHTGTQTLSTISDVTATASELNILDGATVTTTELNYLDGVTSSVQDQLDDKPNSGEIVNADISASANIALSKLATDPLARANHTGTQAASTISDFNTAVRTNRLDQMAAPTATVSMNSQVLSNVATPVNGTDAANKNYVDNAVAGLSWKDAVRAATTANITLSGAQTIDSVSVVAGDRVLVKDQTSSAQNGIYVVASGSWTRATDADSESELLGAAMMVQEGGQASSQWILTTDAPITVGTTSLTFAQFGGGTTYSAGQGINLSSNTFSVDAGTGLEFSGNDLVVDFDTVSRHFAASIGNGSATSIDVTHNFGTRDVVVDVYNNTTYETVECDVVRTDTSKVTLGFAVAPTSNQYRVVVVG